jgi:hypothetical protein
MIDRQYVDEGNSFARSRVIGRGAATSDGAATGRVAFTAGDVMGFREEGEACIWVRYEEEEDSDEGVERGKDEKEAVKVRIINLTQLTLIKHVLLIIF